MTPNGNFRDPASDAGNEMRSTVLHSWNSVERKKRIESMGHQCIATTLVARIDTKNRIEHRPEMGRCEVFVTCQVFSVYSVNARGIARSSCVSYRSDWLDEYSATNPLSFRERLIDLRAIGLCGLALT